MQYIANQFVSRLYSNAEISDTFSVYLSHKYFIRLCLISHNFNISAFAIWNRNLLLRLRIHIKFRILKQGTQFMKWTIHISYHKMTCVDVFSLINVVKLQNLFSWHLGAEQFIKIYYKVDH